MDNPVSLENVESKVSPAVSIASLFAYSTTQWIDEILEYCPGVKVRHISELYDLANMLGSSFLLVCFSAPSVCHARLISFLALKCDLRDDRGVKDRLARYGQHSVQYEEGLAVARRIRASRYLGPCIEQFTSYSVFLTNCTFYRV